MSRLIATVRTDFRLQLRNGFYYAVAFVLAAWALLISQLPDLDLSFWIAPLLLGNLNMATFYFIAGLVLLERREGTLEAQVVTPLRVGEYLASKLITLVMLSVIESVAMVWLLQGLRYRVGWFLLGVVAASVIYILLGFVAVARYDSVNEYLMPSVLFVALLSLPYIDYFDLWTSPLMWLHPLQGALVMMRAAFLPVGAGEAVIAAASAVVWIVVSYVLGRRAFDRFVILGEGAH